MKGKDLTMIKVMTDSSVQLTPEEIEKYKITVVPLSITIDGKVYTDGVDITRRDFVQKMETAHELPKTSQPSIGLFVQKFKELTADGSHCLGIFLAKSLSGTIDAARQAAEMVDPEKITLVDSRFTDRAEGYQVLAACQDAEAGRSIDEIKAHLKQIQDNMHLDMMVVNLKNIIKGGRLGKLTGRVATLLNIRIALTMKDGVISIQRKGRGKKFSKKYDDDIVSTIAKLSQVKKVCLSYVDTPELMHQLADRIKNIRPDLDLLVKETSPIIATHAGTGAYAILFYAEQS